MAKKPGLKARSEAVQAAAQAAQETRPTAARRKTAAAPRKKTSAPEPIKSEQEVDTDKRVGISVRMDARVHDELRRISYETRTSIQALVMQGIEHVISKHPPKGGGR